MDKKRKYLKPILMAAIVVFCLAATSCKTKRTEVVVEPFDTHPEWTADNPDAFWE